MASKIFSGIDAPRFAPHRWRHVADAAEETGECGLAANAAPPAANEDELARIRAQEEREAAYRQGEARGRQSAHAELEEKCQALSRAIVTVASHKSRLRQEAERDVVHLALAVARRILRRQFQIDDDAILGLVKAAFENCSLREVTQVRVHPQFLASVRSHIDEIGAPVSIELSGDASLELGDVILETARGHLDASAHTQLEEIERGFTDAMTLKGRSS